MNKYINAREMMVDCQIRPSDVTNHAIIRAFSQVPREQFVPEAAKQVAYADMRLPITDGRVMLDPRTLAKMLALADPQPNDLVLDIGAGLGYSSAIVGQLSEAVVALEEDGTLVQEATRLLAENAADNVLAQSGPLKNGAPKSGSFDLILIQGAIETLPAALVGQLKEGGRVAAIVIEEGRSQCRLGIRFGDNINWRNGFDAQAPLLPGFEKGRQFVF